jgi:hypothetical protein
MEPAAGMAMRASGAPGSSPVADSLQESERCPRAGQRQGQAPPTRESHLSAQSAGPPLTKCDPLVSSSARSESQRLSGNWGGSQRAMGGTAAQRTLRFSPPELLTDQCLAVKPLARLHRPLRDGRRREREVDDATCGMRIAEARTQLRRPGSGVRAVSGPS